MPKSAKNTLESAKKVPISSLRAFLSSLEPDRACKKVELCSSFRAEPGLGPTPKAQLLFPDPVERYFGSPAKDPVPEQAVFGGV